MLPTQVMSGPDVVVILAPIAIHALQALQLDPRTFALAVAYSGSLAFLTSLGHPVNIPIIRPGGYKFTDFLRMGMWLGSQSTAGDHLYGITVCTT